METYEARLGDQVEDRVSGFTGIVTSLHRFLQGCDRMSVQPSGDEEGKLPKEESFDAPDLKVVKKQVVPFHNRRGKSYTGDVKLGDKVRHTVSRFEGVAVARHIYLNGCDRISIQPLASKGGTKLPEVEAFYAPQLEVIKQGYVKYETPAEKQEKPPGGPPKFMPKMKENDGRRTY